MWAIVPLKYRKENQKPLRHFILEKNCWLKVKLLVILLSNGRFKNFIMGAICFIWCVHFHLADTSDRLTQASDGQHRDG